MTGPGAPRAPRPGERRPDDGATRELIGAWAVDALDDTERAAVDDLLARDPDAAREARGLHETAAVLGAAVAVDAPASVRAAVLDLVARTTQERADASSTTPGSVAPGGTPGAGPADASGSADATLAADAAGSTSGTRGPHVAPPLSAPPTRPGTSSSARPSSTGASSGSGSGGSTRPGGSNRPGGRTPGTPRRRRTWSTVVTALVVALAVAVPSSIAWRESQRASEAQARADRLTTALAQPGARVVSSDLTTGGSAVAVVTADAALVTASGVTAPDDGQVYQLWVMRDGEPLPDATAPGSDGTLEINTAAFRTGDALALTVEPAGGSQAPTSEPVVVLAPA